jgi:hypothetical protein
MESTDLIFVSSSHDALTVSIMSFMKKIWSREFSFIWHRSAKLLCCVSLTQNLQY